MVITIGQPLTQRLSLKSAIESSSAVNPINWGGRIIYISLIPAIVFILFCFSILKFSFFKLLLENRHTVCSNTIRDERRQSNFQTNDRILNASYWGHYGYFFREQSTECLTLASAILLLSSTGRFKRHRLIYFSRAVLSALPEGCRKNRRRKGKKVTSPM